MQNSEDRIKVKQISALKSANCSLHRFILNSVS